MGLNNYKLKLHIKINKKVWTSSNLSILILKVRNPLRLFIS